jgi:hypothetical protein
MKTLWCKNQENPSDGISHTWAPLNNYENCRSPSKIKPCTMRGPEIGKKTVEICNVQNLDNQVNAVVGAHKKGNRNTSY